MQKINLLLNESTILNFRLLWKLFVRYRSHNIFAIVGFFIFLYLNYYRQPIVYTISVPTKAISNHSVSRDLTSLLPADNTNSLTVSELKFSIYNFSFAKSYAELVIKDPDFDQLNLGSITLNVKQLGLELKKTCKSDTSCLVIKVASLLKESYTVESAGSDNRFILTVSSIDEKTVKRLSTIFLKALELNRVHTRQYLVLKELATVSSLIAESHSVIEKIDGLKIIEDQEKLINNISELKEKIKLIQTSTNAELANSSALESKYNENKKSTSNKALPSHEQYDKIKKIQQRIVEINSNISNLTVISKGQRTESDNAIIKQLKKEKDRLQFNIPQEANRILMAREEKFIEGQLDQASDLEFNYQVSVEKVKKLNTDYSSSKTELNNLVQQKITNENKSIGMISDLEFLKNLEKKQMSLKLLSATMTSDLLFEDINTTSKEFRQTTYLKIFLLSFSLSLFIYLVTIITRYFLDDTIYSEEDLKIYLKDFTLIGQVPTFK